MFEFLQLITCTHVMQHRNKFYMLSAADGRGTVSVAVPGTAHAMTPVSPRCMTGAVLPIMFLLKQHAFGSL